VEAHPIGGGYYHRKVRDGSPCSQGHRRGIPVSVLGRARWECCYAGGRWKMTRCGFCWVRLVSVGSVWFRGGLVSAATQRFGYIRMARCTVFLFLFLSSSHNLLSLSPLVSIRTTKGNSLSPCSRVRSSLLLVVAIGIAPPRLQPLDSRSRFPDSRHILSRSVIGYLERLLPRPAAPLHRE
jgi:hypothetical protein